MTDEELTAALRKSAFAPYGARTLSDIAAKATLMIAAADRLEALRAQPVRVKALEWGELRQTEDYSWAQDAKTEIGLYVATDKGWFLHGQTGWVNADEIDDAKAAAQADYERRTMAALEPAPVVIADEMVERAAKAIGYNIASLVSGNNMPDMSGDPRVRIPAARRKHFDDACIHAAREAIQAALTPNGGSGDE